MNNLSEKLGDLVKQDTMKYFYGGKKTLFSETGIKQLDTDEIKQKHAIALKQIMESDLTKNYLKSLNINQTALAIHTLDMNITNELLDNMNKSKYIIA